MKKITFLILMLVTFQISHADFTIYNYTQCTYTVSLESWGYVTVTPGVNLIPATSNIHIPSAKIAWYDGVDLVTQVNVGDYQVADNSMGQPIPPCLTSPFYSAIWTISGNNQSISIF